MKTKQLFKKSLRLLALLAATGSYQEAAAITFTDDSGNDFAAGAHNIPSATGATTNSLITTGAAGAVAVNNGCTFSIPSGNRLELIAATGSAVTFAAGNTFALQNGAVFDINNRATVDFSAITGTGFAGPTASSASATLNLLGIAPLIFSQRRAAGNYFSGNFALVSQNDATQLDVGVAGEFPPCTLNLTRNATLGYTATGTTATNNTAYFGGTGAVVTGAGTLTLGTGFANGGTNVRGAAPSASNPSFYPLFTSFTGTIEVPHASAWMGATGFAPIGTNGTLLLNANDGASTANMCIATTIGSLKVINTGTNAATLATQAAVAVTISSLDLTDGDITITPFAGSTITVTQIARGSRGRLTYSGSGNLIISAGRTSGGYINSGTGTFTLPNV